MNHPNSAIPESAKPGWWRKYETWQANNHEQFLRRWGTKFPTWRNRRTARRLVIALVAAWTLILVCSLAAFFTKWFAIPFVVLIFFVFIPSVSILRAITLNVSDAPAAALDEIQLATRNAARSLAFTLLWATMFIPYLVLIVVSIASRDSVSSQVVYGAGTLLVVLVMAATSLPTCLVGWWLNDPDPEDYAVYDQADQPGTLPHVADNAATTGGMDQ